MSENAMTRRDVTIPINPFPLRTPQRACSVGGRTEAWVQREEGEGEETTHRHVRRRCPALRIIFPNAGITLIRCDGRRRPLATLSARLPELP